MDEPCRVSGWVPPPPRHSANSPLGRPRRFGRKRSTDQSSIPCAQDGPSRLLAACLVRARAGHLVGGLQVPVHRRGHLVHCHRSAKQDGHRAHQRGRLGQPRLPARHRLARRVPRGRVVVPAGAPARALAPHRSASDVHAACLWRTWHPADTRPSACSSLPTTGVCQAPLRKSSEEPVSLLPRSKLSEEVGLLRSDADSVRLGGRSPSLRIDRRSGRDDSDEEAV